MILKAHNVEVLCVHRLSLARKTTANPFPVDDSDLTGEDVIRIFRHRGLGTGGKCPYHVLIKHDGSTDQILSLSRQAMHAGSWNWRSLAIAVVGDMRRQPPTDVQRGALLRAISDLLPFRSGGLQLKSHTDLLPVGSSKECPGQYLPISPLLFEASSLLPSGWQLWNQPACDDYISRAGWLV